jgi:serine/threonine protein kinase
MFKQIIAGVEYCHKNMIVHRDLKPENLLLSADRKQLVISDFGLSTGMQGKRNLLKTRCGTVHYISPEVAKGEEYVGMASDVWSMGIILYAMVTATLPFDGPTSVAVLKKIVRGDFHMPLHLPKELQDLIRLMLTLEPKERITIPQIKQHPWYLGLPDDTPRQQLEPEPPIKPYVFTFAEIQENSDIISNLKLLGWEESELMNYLLDKTAMNMAKVFYKLLIDHKSLPLDEQQDNGQVIDRKVLRRRSVALPARASRIGDAPDTTTKPPPEIRYRAAKRSSQRVAVRRSERPVRNSSNDKHREKAETLGEVESNSSVTPEKTKNVVWGVSPTLEPEAKKFSVESNKSVTQVLEALKNCFADLGKYDISAKHTKNGIKVTARLSGKKHGSPVVTVNLKQKEVQTEMVLKGGGKSKGWIELAKKVEDTLVV